MVYVRNLGNVQVEDDNNPLIVERGKGIPGGHPGYLWALPPSTSSSSLARRAFSECEPGMTPESSDSSMRAPLSASLKSVASSIGTSGGTGH